jgi:catalase
VSGLIFISALFHLYEQRQALLTIRSNDYGQKDLFEAIEKGDHPSWTMKVQTMTEKQAEDLWAQKKINVFDLTHIWPHSEFPLREVGKMTLNENAKVSLVTNIPVSHTMSR